MIEKAVRVAASVGKSLTIYHHMQNSLKVGRLIKSIACSSISNTVRNYMQKYKCFPILDPLIPHPLK